MLAPRTVIWTAASQLSQRMCCINSDPFAFDTLHRGRSVWGTQLIIIMLCRTFADTNHKPATKCRELETVAYFVTWLWERQIPRNHCRDFARLCRLPADVCTKGSFAIPQMSLRTRPISAPNHRHRKPIHVVHSATKYTHFESIKTFPYLEIC